MKTKDLYKYHELSERLECVQDQLEQKHVHDVVYGDSGAPAHSKVTKSVDGYIHGAGTVSLLAEESRLKSELDKIEKFILAIPIKRIKDALKIYCLLDHRRTWPQVANEIGEESPDGLRKAVERYLEEVEE